MSDDQRPDQIEGISTDADGTVGDPELRSNTLAPDLSDPGVDNENERTDAGPVNADLSDDVNTGDADLTDGTEQHNPK